MEVLSVLSGQTDGERSPSLWSGRAGLGLVRVRDMPPPSGSGLYVGGGGFKSGSGSLLQRTHQQNAGLLDQDARPPPRLKKSLDRPRAGAGCSRCSSSGRDSRGSSPRRTASHPQQACHQGVLSLAPSRGYLENKPPPPAASGRVKKAAGWKKSGLVEPATPPPSPT